MDNLIFMIQRGRALTLVKEHISARLRVMAANAKIAKELGCTQGSYSRTTGKVLGLVFETGNRHSDFTKPNARGVSYPKKGSAWAKRFAENEGYPDPVITIKDAFKVPLSLQYGDKRGTGWRRIGSPMTECGFLYLSKDGPYALFVPNVPAEVASSREQGYTVGGDAANWVPHIPGCRLIESEEWDILVAQHKLAQMRADARKAAKPKARKAVA